MLTHGLVQNCVAGIKEVSNFLSNFSQGGESRYRAGKSDGALTIPGQSDEEQRAAADAYSLMDKTKIPPELKFLAGVGDPLSPSDRVFLWHVPRSASATAKAIAAQCSGLLLATEVGGSTASDQLSIVTDLEGGSYVNVDTSTPTGIEHVNIWTCPICQV